MFAMIIQGTITLIMAYLIIANAPNFATATKAAGSVYINAVRALQGVENYQTVALA